MRILLVHNFYQQPGGEDLVFRNEARLLRERGHEVIEYTDHNDRVETLVRLQVAAGTVWNNPSKVKLASVLQQEKPEVAHFHNTFPLVSPAAYYACRSVGVPVVQTLHNYRLLCPAANLYREGNVCEDCLGKSVPWPGVVHGCYRDSRFATSTVAAMLTIHRAAGTWSEFVDVYIALSEFSRRKFAQGGLPERKLVVKPNFLFSDPGVSTYGGQYAISVGRLSLEKGTRNLISAWQQLPIRVPLRIYGDGPLGSESRERAKSLGMDHIAFHGQVPHEKLVEAVKQARFVIVPSGCYENFPMAVIEAFACGIPALASRRGAMHEVIEDGITGLHFDPDDPQDMAAAIEWAWTHPEEMATMGTKARQVFEMNYSADTNYQQLQRIYAQALHN